jgi:hypothetical protein
MSDVMDEIRSDARVRSLIGQLAALTGAPGKELVITALEERLARLAGPVTRDERVQHALAALAMRLPRARGEPEAPSQRELDHLLGYGEEGV